MTHTFRTLMAVLALGTALFLFARGTSASQPEPNAADPLESAVAGMRDAAERLAESDTGSATRDVQKQVLDNLKKLIEAARQSQNQPPASSRPPEAQPQPEPTPEPTQQPDAEQQPSSATPAPGDGARDRTDPDDSDERTGAPPDAQVEALVQRRLVDSVWGHLPPRLREKVQNISGERTLPQYEDLVRRYFEALAEENAPQKGP